MEVEKGKKGGRGEKGLGKREERAIKESEGGKEDGVYSFYNIFSAETFFDFFLFSFYHFRSRINTFNSVASNFGLRYPLTFE